MVVGGGEQTPSEEFTKLQVEINEEKSRIVDLGARAESFGFRGFDFRRLLRSISRQVWRAHYTPKMAKRTRRYCASSRKCSGDTQSQPVDRAAQPTQSGTARLGANYFAIGHSKRVLSSFIRRLGREEDPASHGAISESTRLRLKREWW